MTEAVKALRRSTSSPPLWSPSRDQMSQRRSSGWRRHGFCRRSSCTWLRPAMLRTRPGKALPTHSRARAE
eukprot:scaffold1205_cov70-Phaeocystis_antarctica.AAC.5